MSAELAPAGAVTLVTLDEDSVVTEADATFAALIGPPDSWSPRQVGTSSGTGAPTDRRTDSEPGTDGGSDQLDAGPLRLADLLAPESAEAVLRWCRTGEDAEVGAGVELRGRRGDGLPLVVRAHGVAGAYAASPAAVIDARRPHRRLLLQRAGGPVTWAGSPPAPAPPRTGPDHVLAHDLRGALRTARTFVGIHQRRLAQVADEARAGGVPVPEAVATDQSLRTAGRALAGADALVDALVRFERTGTDPLVVAPVRLVDVVAAAAEQAHSVCAALSGEDGQADLAGGLDVRWDGPEDLAVVADADQLSWVLAELLVNARKYGRIPTDPLPDPAITVSARLRDGWIDLLVASRGRAIDPVLAPEAFVLGRQLQPRGERPGAGLGLPLCRRIVARHGGRIGFLLDPPRSRPTTAATDARSIDAATDAGSIDGLAGRPRGTTIVELRLLADQG